MISQVPKNQKTTNILKISLTFALIVIAFSTSPTSYFGVIKPATAAGTLTSVSFVPSSNLATMMSTYDISFRTGTTGTIKTIEILFPDGQFDVTSATRYLERSGIHSGSISLTNNPATDSINSIITYTVNNPESIPAGTFIRLEIPRIIANVAGNFQATITTKNTDGGIIDGPTLSSKFLISDVGTTAIADNSITGQDLSTSFTIRKTLHDDAVGHAHGWNPDTSTRAYAILDSDISGEPSSEFVSVIVRSGNPAFCAAASGDAGLFGVYCDSPPGNSAELDYIITKLPAHDDAVLALSASSESTPSSASPSLSSSPHTSTLTDIESFNRQDDT
ncbi:MAG: hypothetical protein QOA62_04355, partial [Nitrososphaeraceae archaeon]|nr:hypothetical protein [Nitrososphaeraceae archaeon]